MSIDTSSLLYVFNALQGNSSDRLFLHPGSGSKAFIFVRKTLSVRLRDREGGLTPAQARREGPTFFDEDDACGRIQELPYSLSELLPSLYAVGFFHVDRQASYLGIFHCPHYFIRVFAVDIDK